VRPPQAYAQLPDLAQLWGSIRFVPAQANPRRKLRLLEGFHNESECGFRQSRKIGDACNQVDGFAVKLRVAAARALTAVSNTSETNRSSAGSVGNKLSE
jgi:hypothetical protein